METFVAVLLLFLLVFGGLIGLFIKWLIHRGNLDEIHSIRNRR